jgi:1,4-dihydroxy-6-naphthoate synthase
VAGHYAILSAGTRVSRGGGPVLVSRQPLALEELRGQRVGVAAVPSTDWFLLRCLCPEAVFVEMRADGIGVALASGSLRAGVLRHQDLLDDPQLGLHGVLDLGASWCQRQGLPLPLRLNVVRRDLGSEGMRRVCTAIQESVWYARRHREEAPDWAGPSGERSAQDDALWMPDDVRQGLRVLLCQVVDEGLGAEVPRLDIVEGVGSEPSGAARC